MNFHFVFDLFSIIELERQRKEQEEKEELERIEAEERERQELERQAQEQGWLLKYLSPT